MSKNKCFVSGTHRDRVMGKFDRTVEKLIREAGLKALADAGIKARANRFGQIVVVATHLEDEKWEHSYGGNVGAAHVR
jgi:hypothetical protein